MNPQPLKEPPHWIFQNGKHPDGDGGEHAAPGTDQTE